MREAAKAYILWINRIGWASGGGSLMIKNRELWRRWDSEYRRKETLDFFQNLRLLEGLYEEARCLGVLPLRDPWEGLEVKIRIAKAINVPTAPGENRTRP